MSGFHVFFEGRLDGFIALQTFAFGPSDGVEDPFVIGGEHFDKARQPVVPILQNCGSPDTAG